MEEWRDIKGYEGQYQVSSLGRVKSLERCYSWGRKDKAQTCMPEHIMRPQDNRRGYLQVHLRRPGEHKKFTVHQLVALAFLPNPECKRLVNHLDSNRKNNNLTNLEWATDSENQIHRHIMARKDGELEPVGSDMDF